MGCDCEICADYKRIQQAIDARDPDQLISMLKEFSNRWLNASSDVNYHECVLDGSWPSSATILRECLARIERSTQERIKKKAYQLYCHRIKLNLPGDSFSDWLIAEFHIERCNDGDV